MKHDLRCQSLLDVEPADGPVDGRELGLDLLDQGRERRPARCEQIDGAAITEFVERDLNIDVPPEAAKAPRPRSNELSMAFVEETVDRTSAPGQLALIARPNGGEDRAQLTHAHAREVASLNERHQRLRTAGGACDIDLAQAEAEAQSPQDSADPNIVHVTSIPGTASLPLIWPREPQPRSPLQRSCEAAFRVRVTFSRPP